MRSLKIKSSSRFLGLSVFPCCRERSQIVRFWVQWFGGLKLRATGLEASLSFFSTSQRCSRKRSANFLPASPTHIFMHTVQVIQ